MVKHIYILSVVVLFLLQSCAKEESRLVDPVPIQEMVESYFVEENNVQYLNVQRFNKDNFKLGRIIAINNKVDSLELILMFRQSANLIYYKQGKEIEYTPLN
jgi:hypothetical protein